MRIHRFRFVLLFILFALVRPAQAQTLSCSSDDGGKKYCPADMRSGAHLVKQQSEAVCKQDYSWGYDEKGIWVDHGCSGEFALGGGTSPEAPGGGKEEPGKTITCASEGGKKNYCGVDAPHASVRMVKQLGSSPCTQGTTWGYDERGIWVDHGCRADFLVQGGPSSLGAGAKDKSCLQSVGKQRANQLVKECLKVSPATHPPCNAENSCELIEEEIRRSCGLLGIDAPAFCGGYR